MITQDGKKIIISADDFGISAKANANTLALIEQKKIDRVEIMMSRNITAEHVGVLLSSGIKLDIHLHLAKAELDFWQNNPREMKTGAVKRIFLFLSHYFFGEKRPRVVEKEWAGQIQDFRNIFGRNPDGISSHEHIHFFPTYFRVAVRLAQKYEIPYVRFGKFWLQVKNNICLILNLLRKVSRPFFRKTKLETADFMVSFDWFLGSKALLEHCPDDRITEVIFHPEKDSEFEVLSRL
ncbi:MAG: ChbG/HpnK family deacetylase [Parcubacteria group bacterium]|jgi:predicted glycoside hydrolase/deacetylase ChbG (UPF0249 family)